MEPVVEKVRLETDMDSEISLKTFVECEVVHQIQIPAVAPVASTAVEGNGQSAASMAAQCSPVEAANLVEHLVAVEVVQMTLARDRDYTEGEVSDDDWLRTRVDEEYQGAYTGLDVHNRRTRVEVDTETEDRDIETEGGNVSVSGQAMEIGLIEDWVASVATSDVAEHPSVEQPDQGGSGVAPVEPAGMGEGDADTVVENHIEDWAEEGMKKVAVVAGKMYVEGAVAVDSAMIDEKTVDGVVVKGVEPQLGAETVGNAASHRRAGQGLLGYLEQSFPDQIPRRAAENLDFR